MNTKKFSEAGMTLLELMIVIAIIGILASVAMPSWNSQVVKARRADAANSLFQAQVLQAQYFAENASYGWLGAAGFPTTKVNGTGYPSLDSYYSVNMLSASAMPGWPASGYVVTASPWPSSSQEADSDCSASSMKFCVTQDGPVYGTFAGESCAPKACWD
jgi:type IV pilus assembly protein PilE